MDRSRGMSKLPPLDDGSLLEALEELERGGYRLGVCSGSRKLLWLVARVREGAGPTSRAPVGFEVDKALTLEMLCVPSCLSTMTIMMTPTLPSEPVSGVQCIQRAFPPIMSRSAVTMLALSSVGWTSCRVLGREVRASQEIFAVTPMPCARASMSESRTCSGPPMWSSSLDWQSPGIRSEGDVKIMRREG